MTHITAGAARKAADERRARLAADGNRLTHASIRQAPNVPALRELAAIQHDRVDDLESRVRRLEGRP